MVIATARDVSAPTLKTLADATPKERLHLITLDVSKEDQYPEVLKAVEAVLPNGLDYLIVNAAIDLQTYKTFGNDV